MYFRHLIFDPVPYIDVEFPLIPFFLCLWGIAAFFIIIGYHCQYALIASYVFWIIFVQFTPMQRDFDGGFDAFMTGAGFFLLFMPTDRAFAVDRLRARLTVPFHVFKPDTFDNVSRLSYVLPVVICLGFLYVDSAVHKLFAEHWRNGLGAWLPSTQPYYISVIDMSWLLNQEWLQKLIGYTILIFQFSFLFFFSNRHLRPFYLLVGVSLHLGITLTFNIYPFGLGMLIFYTLLVPFSWWRCLGHFIRSSSVSLKVFYDRDCPLCNRTAHIIHFFDIRNAILFLDAQTFSKDEPKLASFTLETLLTDLYAVDRQGNVYRGVDTYIQILLTMRYLFFIGWLLKTPGIYHLAKSRYRKIADQRQRHPCDQNCVVPTYSQPSSFYAMLFENRTGNAAKVVKRLKTLTKVTMIIIILQLNSTIHYGLLYRFDIDTRSHPLALALTQASNSILLLSHSFLGITPHALYLHDHFEGYDKLIAITYTSKDGNESWLPFVNSQGRLLAPHWGRVHSMWANIAVTPKIDEARLNKFIMKITAFWAHRLGLALDDTVFHIKMKSNAAPSYWVHNLRELNLNNTAWTEIGTATWQNNRFSISYRVENGKH
ncbi:MAG: hypothetical protein Kow0065_06160 [Methylomicrobium sp.]